MKLIIAILLITIGAFAQNTKYKDGTDCKCDSIISTYYKSGALEAEYPYSYGKLNGILTVYYESGAVNRYFRLVNGNREGTSKWYYESGSLYHEQNYVNNKWTGVFKWYFKNGQVAGIAIYDTTEKLIGYKKCTDGRVGNTSLDCLN